MRWSLAVVVALSAPAAWAQAVDLPWSGRLLDGAGAPVNGARDVRLGLWDHPTAGAEVHFSELADLPVEDGYASAVIAGTPLSVLGQSLWLQIDVDGAALGERVAVLPVPVAARALQADEAAHAAAAATAERADEADEAAHAAVADALSSPPVAQRALWVDFDPSENLLTNWAFSGSSGWTDAPDTTTAYLPGYPGLIGPPYAGYTSPQGATHSALGTGNNGACYQWAMSESFPVDPAKAYEFSAWVFSYDPAMNNYLGFFAYDSNGQQIAGSWDNPYFKTGEGDPAVWVRWSGFLLPSTFSRSGGTSSIDFRETNGVDWVWPANTVTARIRFGGCYSTNNGLRSYFSLPMVRELP